MEFIGIVIQNQFNLELSNNFVVHVGYKGQKLIADNHSFVDYCCNNRNYDYITDEYCWNHYNSSNHKKLRMQIIASMKRKEIT